jgi:hypothetical protein
MTQQRVAMTSFEAFGTLVEVVEITTCRDQRLIVPLRSLQRMDQLATRHLGPMIIILRDLNACPSRSHGLTEN